MTVHDPGFLAELDRRNAQWLAYLDSLQTALADPTAAVPEAPELAPLTPWAWTGQIRLTWKTVYLAPRATVSTAEAIPWALPRRGAKITTSSTRTEIFVAKLRVGVLPAQAATSSVVVGTLDYRLDEENTEVRTQNVWFRTSGGRRAGSVTRQDVVRRHTLDEAGKRGVAALNLLNSDAHGWVEWDDGEWVIAVDIKSVPIQLSHYSATTWTAKGGQPPADPTPVEDLLDALTPAVPRRIVHTGNRKNQAVRLTGSWPQSTTSTGGSPPAGDVQIRWSLTRPR